MSDIVEAYQQLLGIPLDEQPPDHYRLLGLERFESDRAAIDAAAKRLMSRLQKQLVGPDQATVRKLLDEVSGARRCLLIADRKAAYDQELRARLDAGQQPESDLPGTLESDLPGALVPEAQPMSAEEEFQTTPEPELVDEPAGDAVNWNGAGEDYGVDEPTAVETEPDAATPPAAPRRAAANAPSAEPARSSASKTPASAAPASAAPATNGELASRSADAVNQLAGGSDIGIAINGHGEIGGPEESAGETGGSFFSGIGLSSGGANGSGPAKSSGAPVPTGTFAGANAAPGKPAAKIGGSPKTGKSPAAKSKLQTKPGGANFANAEPTEGKSNVKKPVRRGPEMWQIMIAVGGGVLVLIVAVAILTSGGSPETQTTTTAPTNPAPSEPQHIRFGPQTVVGPIDDRTVLSPVVGTSAQVPIERHGDLMLADVKINDEDAGKFLLDTGTRDLIVSKAVADKLNLPSRRDKNLKLPGGVQTVTERKIESLAMGPVRFEQRMILPTPRNNEWLAIAVDMKPWADALHVPIVGVIGGEIWSQVPFSIDPERNVATFYKRGPFPFSAGLNPEFLTRFDNFLKPAVTANIDHGPDGTFLLATGAPAELMVNGSAPPVKSLSAFGGEIPNPTTVESKDGDGYFDANNDRQSGVIGAGILSHYLLMFDYAGEKFLAVPIKK